jgi:hypothetical protein
MAQTPIGQTMAPRRRGRRDDFKDRQDLVAALRARPGEGLRAGQLKEVTGVPKMHVRRLLTQVNGITVTGSEQEPWFAWTGQRLLWQPQEQ